MAYSGTAAVKSEILSDEEDSSSQLPDLFLNDPSGDLEELAPLAPAGPAATPVCVKQEPVEYPAQSLEILESSPNATGLFLEEQMAILMTSDESSVANFTPLQVIKEEPASEDWQTLEQHTSGDEHSGPSSLAEPEPSRGSPKTWRQQDMDHAIDALKNRQMSLTKASAAYGIPSTTLWQRAHRLGIDTPKKEGAAKSWTEEDLRAALQALRAGAISANKASKAYGIPSSTLYKIARREGIRLAAPFNAAPVAWRRADLTRALLAIRAGRASVQRAAAHYGIPTGTLYGRCKREGIELSRSNPTPWSEDAMGEALEAVRIGQMSINQAAIHFNLPYSSLYGRFKRCKYSIPPSPQEAQNPPEAVNPQDMPYYHQMQMYPDHEVQPPCPPDYAQDASAGLTLQDPYCGQNLYYNQNFSSIVTS